ncbi:MAG: hypothetical protein EXR81_06645 [Gammaproteobacteria bacterium]|nr:hypothetical protein [Gammaproteobacteria bacterium]
MYKLARISTCLMLAILPILPIHGWHLLLPIHAAGFLGIPDAHPYVGINLGLASVQASGTSQTQTPYESNPETFTTHNAKQATQYAIATVCGHDIPSGRLADEHQRPIVLAERIK